jgi:hypothetical protein
MEYAIFDCPEASQTSPTRTSLSTIRFSPVIVIFRGLAEAGNGCNASIHLPVASAVALTF